MTEATIEVLPIAGYSAAAHPSGMGLLIIEHLPGAPPPEATPEQIARATRSMQYAIRAEQCEEIAKVLTELASKLRAAKTSLN